MSGFNRGTTVARRSALLRSSLAWTGLISLSMAVALTGLFCPFTDTDMDGVADTADNCPADANADQADADGDGTGDVCDGCPNNAALTTDADNDADGVLNCNDNCPNNANPGQEDADNNGTGDVCEPVPAPVVNAGNDRNATGGSTITLTAQVTDGRSPIAYDWSVNDSAATAGSASIDDADTQTPAVTFSPDAEGVFTFTCVVTDADNRQDSDTVDVTVTPNVIVDQLVVEAGNLVGRRSAVTGLGNIGLLVGAVDGPTFTSTWTLVSAPAGAGAISIIQPNALVTNVNFGPPTPKGIYTFQLTATSLEDNQVDSDTVDLTVVDTPTLVVMGGFAPMRFNFFQGSTSRDLTVEATTDSQTTYTIVDNTGANGLTDSPAADDTMGTLSVPDTNGAAQSETLTLNSTGARATDNPATLSLAWQAIDTVGIVPATADGIPAGAVDLIALTDLTNAAASLQQFTIYNSTAWTFTPAGAGTPPVIQFDDAGAFGNANVGVLPAAPNAAAPAIGNVHHQGVGGDNGGGGPSGGDPVLVHITDLICCGDINGDGLLDLVVLQAGAIVAVRWGSPDIVNAANANNANPAAWSPAAGTTGVTYTGGVALANSVGLACGDFNGDGVDDIAVLQNNAAGAQGLRVVFSEGGDTPFANDRNVFYNVSENGDFAPEGGTPARIATADVNGDGVDDVVIAAPGFDNGDTDRGAILSINGVAGTLPTINWPAGNVALAAATTAVLGEAPAGQFNGQFIPSPADADNDAFGGCFGVVNVNGGPDDVVAGYGAAETDLFVYAGIANQRLSNAALRTYTSEGAATLNLGIATGGDLTGTGSATAQDIVLGAPAAAAGNGRTYVIPNTAPNGTTLAPGGVVLSYTGAAGGNNVGSAVLALDYNGDGQEDLLSGDNGGAVVDIFFGPIATNLNNPNDIDLQFTGNGNFGQSIVSCDVNGDGVSDLLIGNSGADLFMLAGLE